MRTVHVCENGHSWESVGVALGEPAKVASQGESCPVCGSSAHHQETVASRDLDATLKGSFNYQETLAQSLSAQPLPAQPLAPSLHPSHDTMREDESLIDDGAGVPPYRPPIADRNPFAGAARPIPGADADAMPVVPGYRLIEVLGKGGMGVVYRAVHLELNRPCALKMVRDLGDGSDEHIERMRKEATAIARVAHPNIVQIFDVGTADGRPYLALELVTGQSLDKHFDSRPQPSRDAAQLIATMSRGVDRMHQEGIIHRDLKPSNIMMDPNGQPKIADFGLAKLMEINEDETRTGAILGTPNFMSPEQASGQNRLVDHRADIYAVGGILYYLLTGRPPFQSESLVDILRQVTDDDPISPRLLNPTVDRDVETICLKCLEKRPGRRYETSAELADDLQRYLDHEPIRARPLGPVERLGRWYQRNPRIAQLALTVFLVAAAGVAGVIWQWQDAEAARRHAESETSLKDEQRRDAIEARADAVENELMAIERLNLAKNFLMRLHVTLVDGRIANDPRADLLRTELMNTLVSYYESFLVLELDDPFLLKEKANAHYLLGNVLSELSQLDEAENAFTTARRIQTELSRQDAPLDGIEQDLANTLTGLGTVAHLRGDLDAAHEQYQNAIEMLRALSDAGPQDANLSRELGIVYRLMGGVELDRHQYADARRYFESALEWLEANSTHWEPNSMNWLELASTYSGLAIATSSSSGGIVFDQDAILESHDRSIEICDEFLADFDNRRAEQIRAIAYQNRAFELTRMDRYRTALESAEVAVSAFDRLMSSNPDVPDFVNHYSSSCLVKALAMSALYRLDESESLLLESIEVQQELVAEYGDSTSYRETLARIYHQLAGLYLEWELVEPGKVQQSLAWYDEAHRAYEALMEDLPNETRFEGEIADVESVCGAINYDLGNAELGIRMMTDSIERQEEIWEPDSQDWWRAMLLVQTCYKLAKSHGEQGDAEMQNSTLRRAVAVIETIRHDDDAMRLAFPYALPCIVDLAKLQDGAGRSEEARVSYELGLEWIVKYSTRSQVPVNRSRVVETAAGLSRMQLADDKLEDAERTWDDSRRRLDRDGGNLIDLLRDSLLHWDRHRLSPFNDPDSWPHFGTWMSDDLEDDVPTFGDGRVALRIDRDGRFQVLLFDTDRNLKMQDFGTFQMKEGQLTLSGQFGETTLTMAFVGADDRVTLTFEDSNVFIANGQTIKFARISDGGR